MSTITLTLLIIGILVGIVTLILFQKRKREGRLEDWSIYQSLFILGISLTPVGIVLMVTTGNPVLGGMAVIGFIYLIIGLVNRTKWSNK